MRKKLPYMSAASLSGVLKDVEEHGTPGLHQQKHIKEARTSYTQEQSSYGPLIDSVDVTLNSGEVTQMLVINLLTFLQTAYSLGTSFCDLVQKTAQEHPPSSSRPWRLIYYSDEVTPGNPLSAEVSRKIWTGYVSFLEFGPVILSRESAWVPIFAKRTSLVNLMAAGISQVTAAVLSYVFNHSCCSVSTGGLLLSSNTCSIRLYFVLGCFLQDGLAHKQIFSLKGDAGTKFCLFCSNLVTESSGLVTEAGEALLTCNTYDEGAIVKATNETFSGSVPDFLSG